MKFIFCTIVRKFSVSRCHRTTSKKWQQVENGHDTGIKIYNCIANKVVPLKLRYKNLATWYQCGPTVYDSSHIGHASCYVKLDIIQRILTEYFKINLVTAINITDIDDKIINKGLAIGDSNSWSKISKKYEQDFWKDMKLLGLKEPNIKLRVTENIPDIIAFIQQLIQRGIAYVGGDKSVYFNLKKFPNYGKLQILNTSAINCQTIEKEFVKNSSNDFVLWKAKKSSNEPSWPTPWSVDGRPGWHIECSTLASKVFGRTIDFHAGGLDLKFPHHENEEAQSCAYHQSNQWVNYWIHTGNLKLPGDESKMSKSLKNTINIEEMLKTNSKDEFRMACILSNYRSSMEYSDAMMTTARNTLHRFKSFQSDCKALLEGKLSIENLSVHEILKKLDEIEVSIDYALKDDFNTAKCIGLLMELMSTVRISFTAVDQSRNTVNNSILSIYVVAAVNNYNNKILSIFGFDLSLEVTKEATSLDSKIFIDEILAIRENLRKLAINNKYQYLFKLCDDIRDDLKAQSIEIKDYGERSSWHYVEGKK